uniref:Uncharacterized protein n=1 Tax=Rhizophora mucronata TaxID=61149 RepID=A0A2P2JXC9_RHIMU
MLKIQKIRETRLKLCCSLINGAKIYGCGKEPSTLVKKSPSFRNNYVIKRE